MLSTFELGMTCELRLCLYLLKSYLHSQIPESGHATLRYHTQGFVLRWRSFLLVRHVLEDIICVYVRALRGRVHHKHRAL